MPGPTLSISIDYGSVLSERTGNAVARVAEIMTRTCFAESLTRVSTRRGDRWLRHTKASRESIAAILRDPTNDSASFDNGRSGELVASAEIDSGSRVIGKGGRPTRFTCYLAIPYVASALEDAIIGVCDLAAALDAAAGFVALEPDRGLAHRVALGGAWPKPRLGLSDQRRRERRARHRYDDLLGEQIANVEWATLLGPGHLARVLVDELRASGAFVRVIEIVPGRLVLVQVTAEPMDDLREVSGLEEKLVDARMALRPILMDVGDVSLDEP